MVSIYFFVPNIIGISSAFMQLTHLPGYLRIITGFWAIAIAFNQPLLFLVLYSVSALLDALDGHAARYFNQCEWCPVICKITCLTVQAQSSGLSWTWSQIDAVLRLSKLFLPNYCLSISSGYEYCYGLLTFQFPFLITVDFFSHYTHMNASLLRSSNSHKVGILGNLGLLDIFDWDLFITSRYLTTASTGSFVFTTTTKPWEGGGGTNSDNGWGVVIWRNDFFRLSF